MEYFDIRTANGALTGQTKERSQVHRDGDTHGTAHIWILRPNKEGSFDLLLQRRSPAKDSHPNCLDISTAGHLSAGQDFLEAALRELEEELGIRARPEELHFVGMHHGIFHGEYSGVPFHDDEISAVYLYTKPVEAHKLTLQTEEVASVTWMRYEDCLSQVKAHSAEFCIFADELEMIYPAACKIMRV